MIEINSLNMISSEKVKNSGNEECIDIILELTEISVASGNEK